MRLIPTILADCILIEPRVHGDARGFFFESWNARAFAEAGLDIAFVQDNHSRSNRGVLRGLHFQHPNPQGKLMRVAAGAIWDVAIDLRRGSPDLGRWTATVLSAANHTMLWVPPGFGHGFLTLEDDTDVLYKCTAPYSPGDEHAIRWDDPDLAIAWPLDGLVPQLSAKDQAGIAFADAELFA